MCKLRLAHNRKLIIMLDLNVRIRRDSVHEQLSTARRVQIVAINHKAMVYLARHAP